MKRRDWLECIFGIGFLLRMGHLLGDYSVWHDEAAMILNVLFLDFSQMFGPLIHSEAAPPLFLILERLWVLLPGGGDSQGNLRVLPCVASIFALSLFSRMARRSVGFHAAIIATLLVAVSDRLLFHAVEAKAYSFDVLIAVVTAWWFVRCQKKRVRDCCRPAMLVAPFAIWLSFPACFVLGGLMLGLLHRLWNENAPRRDWLSFLGLGLCIGGAFLGLALGPAYAQRTDAMESCWLGHFPNFDKPLSVPGWSLSSSFEVMRYCFLPVGQIVGLFAIVGALSLVRRRRSALVIVLLSPMGLALIASFLGKYPYGGSRLEVFLAPAFALLAGEGLRRLWPIVAKRNRLAAWLMLLLLVGPPIGLTAYRVIEPWPRADCEKAAKIAIQERNPSDMILVNHWEYEYYLRHESDWRMWLGAFEPSDLQSGRVIVIHTDAHIVDEFPFPIPEGWHVAESVAVPQTRVFVIEKINVEKTRR